MGGEAKPQAAIRTPHYERNRPDVLAVRYE
jgi:hypothetical protein